MEKDNQAGGDERHLFCLSFFFLLGLIYLFVTLLCVHFYLNSDNFDIFSDTWLRMGLQVATPLTPKD